MGTPVRINKDAFKGLQLSKSKKQFNELSKVNIINKEEPYKEGKELILSVMNKEFFTFENLNLDINKEDSCSKGQE
jgi:hypothetical protein